MSGINEIITNINHMYQTFNKDLDAQLPEDVVFSLIPNRGKSKYLGWFAQSRWISNTETIHEINIAPDFLNRPVSEIAETLIHEMAHLKNNVLKIKDCTPTQYHNKAFKKQAEAFGLKVEKMKNKGYALTSVGDRAKEIIEDYKAKVLKGNNPFIIHRVSEIRPPTTSTKKSVAIDRNLADTIANLNENSLSKTVDQILRTWVSDNT